MKSKLLIVSLFVLALALIVSFSALAHPPEPTPFIDSGQLGGPVRRPGYIRLEGVEKPQKAPKKALMAGPTDQGWTDITTEDFEGAFPGAKWSLYGDSTWGKESYRQYNGGWSGYCAGGGTNAVNPPGPYPNNMNTWMVYGSFDLRDASDAELLFYHWTRNEENYDKFWVVASTNFEDWWGYWWSGDWAGECGGWCECNFDLTDVGDLGNLCGQSEVWIAFVFESDSSITYEGTYIDDLVLRKFVGEEPGTVTIQNEYLEIEIGDNGLYRGWTAEGDAIFYPYDGYPWSTFISVKTDGTVYHNAPHTSANNLDGYLTQGTQKISPTEAETKWYLPGENRVSP